LRAGLPIQKLHGRVMEGEWNSVGDWRTIRARTGVTLAVTKRDTQKAPHRGRKRRVLNLCLPLQKKATEGDWMIGKRQFGKGKRSSGPLAPLREARETEKYRKADKRQNSCDSRVGQELGCLAGRGEDHSTFWGERKCQTGEPLGDAIQFREEVFHCYEENIILGKWLEGV